MSVPDHELDEPSDTEWCAEHNAYRPCAACRADEVDRQHDARKERTP